MPDPKIIKALNDQRRELVQRIEAITEAILAMGGVPDALQLKTPQKESVVQPQSQELSTTPVVTNPNKAIEEKAAHEKFLLETYNYDVRANWRDKILFAVNELKYASVPDIINLICKYEKKDRDEVLNSITWYASQMSHDGGPLLVKKINSRNMYYLPGTPPPDETTPLAHDQQ